MVVIVMMGICGSGKTTIGRMLSEKTGWPFLDADDYHPECNRQKMAKGIPLNDEDREGWLITLHQILKRWRLSNQSGILACSALKQSYRSLLCRGPHHPSAGTANSKVPPQYQTAMFASSDTTDTLMAEPQEASSKTPITFVYLRGSKELIISRMKGRDGHFMPVELVDSQLKDLEEPVRDEGGIRVLTEDVSRPIQDILSDISGFIAELH